MIVFIIISIKKKLVVEKPFEKNWKSRPIRIELQSLVKSTAQSLHFIFIIFFFINIPFPRILKLCIV